MARKDPVVLIIGSGIVGCFVALELSKKYKNICILERHSENKVTLNQSWNNSGVLHSGINYDKATRPLKADLCVKGNSLLYDFCHLHDVPYQRNGKLMVANSPSQENDLLLYLNRAKENKISGVRLLTSKEVRRKEPDINATAALWVPSAGVLSPQVLMAVLFKILRDRGVRIVWQQEVLGIEKKGDTKVRVEVKTPQGNNSYLADRVINAGGVLAVNLAKSMDQNLGIKTALIRGDSYKFVNRPGTERSLQGTSIYPVPTKVVTQTGTHHTVGVHLTPIWHCSANGKPILGEEYLIGPKLTAVDYEDDFLTELPPPREYLSQLDFYTGLVPSDLKYFHCSVQARLDGYHDFHISRDKNINNVMHLMGIDSPGLTAAPAIARHINECISNLEE